MMILSRRKQTIASLIALTASWFCLAYCDGSSSSPGMILRIRLADGSMEKVLVPEGAEKTMSLSDLLNPFDIKDGSSIQVGKDNQEVKDTSSPLSGLGVKHGSLITIQSSLEGKVKLTESRFSQLKVRSRLWDPYPELAKDYEHALLKTKTRRSSQKGMSFADISNLQSSLHIVEAQPEGPITRAYMCRNSAERFHVNGLVKKKQGTTGTGGVISRVGLLLGTIQTERVNLSPRKARTSLSSQTSDSEFCTVAKIQAIWEPPGQKGIATTYDDTLGQNLLEENPRVMVLAKHLGLVPVGWIFSHSDPRHQSNDDALPVFGLDIQTGATLQIANMKKNKDDKNNELDGAKFVTLAMDANTGATEAFQLSDVSVQMVFEDMLVTKSGESKRIVPTKHAVLVDSKETCQLDSVMCMVNTAMLSHVGSYAGKTATSSVKKVNGNLTNKAKKALSAVVSLDDDRKLLEELCDFNTLLALDQTLSEKDSEELCQAVRKWARGQKEGTLLGSKLKMHLRSVLET